MKLYILFVLLFISGASFAQCDKCNSLEEALKSPRKVKSLIINGNMHEALDSIPSSILKLENLEILYLSDQQIDSVPPWISKLIKLKELSISGCQLTKIPEEMYMMTYLKELLLLSNPFSEEYKTAMRAKFQEKMPATKVEL